VTQLCVCLICLTVKNWSDSIK